MTPSRALALHRGRERTWQLLLVMELVLAVVYVVIPYGLFSGALYVAATATAAVVVALAVGHGRRLYCPRAWVLVACSLALAAVGHAIWYWLDLRGLEPFPSLADAFYLGVYPLFAAALWQLGRHSGRDEHARNDALIVGVSAAVVGWTLLIAPYLNDPGLTMVQLIVSAAYPVADLILLPLVLQLVFLHRTRIPAHQFLLMGMLAYLAADILYAYGNSTGWYAPGAFTDALWLLAYALFMAAAWHPSASVQPHSNVSRGELSRRRLLVLGAATVLVPVVILLTEQTDIKVVRIGAIASILLFILVMYRMAGLMKETHRQSEELEKLSRTDELTGAANRRHFDYELSREMLRAERTGTGLSIAFLDLDRFKEFNDTYGHAAGDALLHELVSAWRGVLRPTDLLARIGGDEFVLAFPHTTTTQCREAVDRLRGAVPHGETCSAGIATYKPGNTVESILERADRALYTAKNRGRNQIVLAGDNG